MGFVAWMVGYSVSQHSKVVHDGTGTFSSLCRSVGNDSIWAGVGVILALWVAVDVILGTTYLVWRNPAND
jgi:hypothetical protein